jgi:hypothetical protein
MRVEMGGMLLFYNSICRLETLIFNLQLVCSSLLLDRISFPTHVPQGILPYLLPLMDAAYCNYCIFIYAARVSSEPGDSDTPLPHCTVPVTEEDEPCRSFLAYCIRRAHAAPA